MRFFTGLAGVWLGTGLSLTGAALVMGCGEDFDGCEASRTCNKASAGNGGMGGADQGGKGGKGGNAGTSGTSGSKGGRGGSAAGGKSGKGGAAGEAGDGGSGAVTTGEAGSRAAAGTMGSGEGGASGEAGGDSGPSVDDRPHVVETSPKNGEKGVLADVDIIVTFSEPMDNASTQAAYSSDDLPPDAVTLSWLENNTKLLIQPKEPLVYASVDSLEGDAKHYSFTIAGTATDLAGNALGDDHNYVFTTMRHIKDTLPIGGRSYGRELHHSADGAADYVEAPCREGANVLEAGDTDENVALAFIAAFKLTDLPDGVLEWTSASVRSSFTTGSRNPFSRLDDLMAQNIVGELTSFDWHTPAVEELGVAASFPSMARFDVDVLDAVKREYEHRDERPFSVLFSFQQETDNDDAGSVVRVRCDGLLLDFSLTAP